MKRPQHQFAAGALLGLPLVLAAAGLIAAGGCRPRPAAAEAPPPPLVEEASSGPIACRITAESAVRLDHDFLLTIRIRAPADTEVRLPNLDSRLEGFVVNGAYDREPVSEGGCVVREHCFKLTPTLAEEYRLGPLAISYSGRSRQAPGETSAPPAPADVRAGWFATRPMIFKAAALAPDKTDPSIADILGPIHIYPAFKTVMFRLGLALLAAAALYGLWLAGRRIRREVQLRRMSPRERALHELSELIARDLIAKQRLKEFYLEITLIVRRYIERAHAIRAPEQTTEEFLAAAVRDARFSREVVLKLKTFLQTADLVKFAVLRPDAATVERTLQTARAYLETDEQERQRQGAAHVV